jgi:hypothetical protein
MQDLSTAQAVQVQPQANQTQAPEQLPQPKSGAISELEANQRQVARLYHQLASQHCSLLEFLSLAPKGCEPWLQIKPSPD